MIILMRLVQQLRALLVFGVCFFMVSIPISANAEQTFSLFISGQVQPLISNPAGLTLGVEPGTGQLRENIANADLNLSASQSFVAIPSPTTGVYSITIHGSYEQTIMIKVGYRDTVTGTNFEITQQALFHGDTIQFTAELSPSADNPLLITPPVATPFNVEMEDNAGLGRLTWNASSDPAVVGYRVYGRLKQSALFQPLDDITTNFFDTPHVIRVDDTGDHWKYIVVSLAEDGRESFYSNVINNRIWVSAFFDADVRSGIFPLTVAFTDDSIGGPTTWSWDFDGDAVTDSTVQNPSHTFDVPGKYPITLSIETPSGQDTQTVTDYIVVHTDTDTDGIGDGEDNCNALNNPDQLDTDGDGYGNRCDADLDNNGFVNSLDLGLFKLVFFTNDTNADLNGDGFVNSLDLGLFKQLFFQPPGPSAYAP